MQGTSDDALDAELSTLEALARQEAVLFAAQMRSLAECLRLADQAFRADGFERFLVMDVAGTLRIAQSTATSRLHQAQYLVQVLPHALTALEDGRLGLPQLRSVLEHTRACSDPVAAEVVSRLLAAAGPDGLVPWTAGRLTRRLQAEVLAVEATREPDESRARRDRARAGRQVRLRAEPDGMTSLWALLGAEQAEQFARGLDELTRRQGIADQAAGVQRSTDQRRADVLAALPGWLVSELDRCAGDPTAGGAHPLAAPAGTANCQVVLHVHVPLATALGASSTPGLLDGYGPVSADHARRLLPSATLHRVLVDPTTGRPVRTDPAPRQRRAPTVPRSDEQIRAELLGMLPSDADVRPTPEPVEPQYRPSAGLQRLVRLRDPFCTAPGCSSRSAKCDLDHWVPYPSGPTSAANLAPLSRRCHRAKTISWTVTRNPDGGCQWRGPTGRSYYVSPPWEPPPAVEELAFQPIPLPGEFRSAGWDDQPLAEDLRSAGTPTAPAAQPQGAEQYDEFDVPPF